MQPLDSAYPRIIDVSQYQGGIDFQAVKSAGYVGVYVKATAGATIHDPNFGGNYYGAKLAGLLRGAYNYAYPATSTALEEADAFVDTVNAAGGFDGLPPVLDMEEHGGLSNTQIADYILTWFDRVRARTGREPILYTYVAFAENYLIDPRLMSLKLWIADYGVYAPPDLPVWGRWTLFQYTSSGSVPGVNGRCDISAFAGSYADLLLLCNQKGVSGMLQYGDSGSDVVQLQKDLNTILHISLATDGQFGPATLAAVKSFQQQFIGSNGVDGIAGSQTMAAIATQLAKATTTSVPTTPVITSSNSATVATPQSIADAESALLAAINAEKSAAEAQVKSAADQVAAMQAKVSAAQTNIEAALKSLQ